MVILGVDFGANTGLVILQGGDGVRPRIRFLRTVKVPGRRKGETVPERDARFILRLRDTIGHLHACCSVRCGQPDRVVMENPTDGIVFGGKRKRRASVDVRLGWYGGLAFSEIVRTWPDAELCEYQVKGPNGWMSQFATAKADTIELHLKAAAKHYGASMDDVDEHNLAALGVVLHDLARHIPGER